MPSYNTVMKTGFFIPITLTGGISYTADVYARQDGSTTTNSNVVYIRFMVHLTQLLL